MLPQSTAGSQLCESTSPHLLYPSMLLSFFSFPFFPPQLLLLKRSSKKYLWSGHYLPDTQTCKSHAEGGEGEERGKDETSVRC